MSDLLEVCSATGAVIEALTGAEGELLRMRVREQNRPGHSLADTLKTQFGLWTFDCRPQPLNSVQKVLCQSVLARVSWEDVANWFERTEPAIEPDEETVAEEGWRSRPSML